MFRIQSSCLPNIGRFIIVLFVAGLAEAGVGGPWIAFRYDASRVLFYTGEAKDTAGFTGQQLSQPAAKWGGGGYLIPLRGGEVRSVALGEAVTVRISAKETLRAKVEQFVEQWGSSNPVVQVGVLAEIEADGLTRFRSSREDYFLAYRGKMLAGPAARLLRPEITGSRHVLNRFGAIGELIVIEGEAGWNVRLWRRYSGKLMPTGVVYSFGD